MELVDSAITAESLSQTWSDLCKSASELLTSVGIKGAQIEFVLVILPECRDFDGMEVIVCQIHFWFSWFVWWHCMWCFAEEVEKVFKNLGVVYQLCLPLTIRIPTNGHLKKFARQIKFKVSLPLLWCDFSLFYNLMFWTCSSGFKAWHGDTICVRGSNNFVWCWHLTLRTRRGFKICCICAFPLFSSCSYSCVIRFLSELTWFGLDVMVDLIFIWWPAKILSCIIVGLCAAFM